MGVTCPECRRSVPGELPLCQYCGARLQPPVACKACGHTITANLAKCPYCNAATENADPPAPSPASAPETAVARAAPKSPAPPPQAKPAGPPDLRKLRIDATARVMWGEDRQAVRSDLVTQGFPGRAVDMALDDAFKERHAHFRKAGLSDVGTAIGCCIGFVVAVVLFVLAGKRARNIQLLAVLFTAMGVFPAAAVFFFTRGISRLLGGGREEREATDVEDDD